MENPTPPSNTNDDLKIKPMLKEYTPITALIKGGFVDESISSMSAEIFTNFMNNILKHNQSSLIERVVDKRPPPNKVSSINKIKTNFAPMTLQSEPPALNIPTPSPPTTTEPPTPNSETPLEVGGHKRGRTAKQSVKTKTQSKKNKK
jgi:hypothetical protein